MTFYYPFGLLLLFYVFLVIEFFVPSAGLLAVLAILTAIATAVAGFSHSIGLGFTMIFLISVSAPAILYFMIKFWPHTPIGRRILNRKPGDQLTPAPESKLRDGTLVTDLVGQLGIANTDLLPSGQVVINGEKLDAVSRGMAIDAGTQVVVVSVSAGKIQVRAATESEKSTTPANDPTSGPSTAETNLGSFDLDALE